MSSVLKKADKLNLSLSVKFQGRMGQKIDDLALIWARLLDWLQLSNPLDLPC